MKITDMIDTDQIVDNLIDVDKIADKITNLFGIDAEVFLQVAAAWLATAVETVWEAIVDWLMTYLQRPQTA